MSTAQTFDLTPDPKVLIALTRTPLSPLDALCELIDNALDGFSEARIQGMPIHAPLVVVALPTRQQVRSGTGVVMVTDNGPGMTAAATERAIRAGFSGNNQFDSLGLFGMGFNIATGKLGSRTELLTCRANEDATTRVEIDLEKIRQSRSFRVPYDAIRKSPDFPHGTQLRIDRWWPDGDANHGFVEKLLQYGIPSIRREVGRRYATILRRRQIRILLNDEECVAFEHCAWGADRFVERRGHGQIPARLDFDEVVGSQRRCNECMTLVEPESRECPVCRSEAFRTIQERVRGWIGVQRFDDATNYGIDLIRNGRAIRVGEKAAFFEWVDELKRVTKDYPIDQQYGRLIGEVHLDHVPVDFLKQDFQRSSSEWTRALNYLRGSSSLQPNAEGAAQNTSPMYRMYQGYRRVRTPGRTDMYMGYWDLAEEKPKRIPREKERELYDLFTQRLPGFFDDSEWWKLVEQAERRPVVPLSVCGQCGAQNPQEAEMCLICANVLRGHPCVNPECSALVPLSANACGLCGTAQHLEEQKPWTCQICRHKNLAAASTCGACGAGREQVDPISEVALLADSSRDDALSRVGFSVRMPDGGSSQPIDLEVYRVNRALQPFGSVDRCPLVRRSELSKLQVFLDPAHMLFRLYRQPVEVSVAEEVAAHVIAISPRPPGARAEPLYSISAVAARVLQTLMGTPDSPEDAFRRDAAELLISIKERLGSAFDGASSDLYESMDESERRELVENLIAAGVEILRLNQLVASGSFIDYVGVRTIQRSIDEYPQRVFDGGVWRVSYTGLSQVSEQVASEQQSVIRRRYAALVGDVADQMHRLDPDQAIRDRAQASLRYLRAKLA